MKVSIRKFRIIVLLSNQIKYCRHYSNWFEILNIRTALIPGLVHHLNLFHRRSHRRGHRRGHWRGHRWGQTGSQTGSLTVNFHPCNLQRRNSGAKYSNYRKVPEPKWSAPYQGCQHVLLYYVGISEVRKPSWLLADFAPVVSDCAANAKRPKIITNRTSTADIYRKPVDFQPIHLAQIKSKVFQGTSAHDFPRQNHLPGPWKYPKSYPDISGYIWSPIIKPNAINNVLSIRTVPLKTQHGANSDWYN